MAIQVRAIGVTGEGTSGGGIEQPKAKETARVLSKKIIAIMVVVIIVSASTCVIWYFYFRHWSASELADKLIKEEAGGYSGFDHDLAGKSIIVEGEVTSIEEYASTLGTATVVELDDVYEANLVFWDNVSYELGERIERKVSFEWAFWNDEKHVYSSQVWLPFAYAFGAALVTSAVSYVWSDGGLIRVFNEDNDVRVEIDWLGEPALLETTNCTLVSGTRSGIMDQYFIYDSDGHHNETDTINDLTNNVGHNNTIEFSDENGDGYLDNGDSFVLRNLTRPDSECGIKTYMLVVEWALSPDMDPDHVPIGLACYIPMLKEGAAWPAWWQDQSGQIAPAVRGFLEPEDGAQTLTIDYVGGTIPWENVTIQLSDGTNFAKWEPTTVNPLAESLGIKKLGQLDVDARIMHTADNNLLSMGDHIQVSAASPSVFSSNTVYTLAILYEETGSWITQKEFCVNDTPVASFRPYPSLGGGTIEGTGFTFTPVHVGVNNSYRPLDLPWDDLVLNLTDGTNNVSWAVTPNLLHIGFGVGQSFGKLALGSLNVTLFVRDLNGDGQVNNGDRIELMTPDAAGFDVSTTYSVTAIYSQKGTDICTAEFTG